MSICYFWKDGEILVINEQITASTAKSYKVFDLFCVDAYVPREMVGLRYGVFTADTGWKGIPFCDFPNEFKVHLLLLGVGA
jgi:hypothetical protein